MRVVCPPWTCRARVLPAVVCGAAVLLAGCGNSNTTPPGTPVLTMGDLTNSTDFESYIVDIDSITLTATDGTLVEPLSTVEEVDLVNQNSMTELVEAPAVPSGTYTSASVTVDYTAASLWLNLNGLRGTPVSILSNTGAVALSYAVTVTFDPSHPLVITAGQSVRLHLDFDINASTTVTSTTASPPTVQVQPFVSMTVAPVDSTVMRGRGLFVVVPTGASIPPGTSGTFIMNLRPFYDLVSALGAVFVSTNSQTYWNVNGVAYTGTAGLTALSAQQVNTPIVAYGTLDNLSGITPTFNATSVFVGSSQESPLAEYLTGTVAARSGDTLLLRGVSYLTPTGTNIYVSSTPVVIGADTIISQDGVVNPNLSATSVSVGQQINVSGQANVDPTTGDLLGLDATAGQVRLQPTSVWGTPKTVAAGSVTLDVLQLGGFEPNAASLDFSGTGTTQNADPSAYIINTGSLDTSAITPGSVALATGIVAPFGGAPPDFIASAITPGSSTLQTLVVEWIDGGSLDPFPTRTGAGLTLNLDDPHLGTIHYIRTGPTEVDLKTLPAGLLITTVGADQSNLDLAVGSATLTTGVSVFQSADRFATGLNTALNGVNRVFRLVAYGQYNASTNTFVTSRIRVALEETTTS
jgi:hypothetical protein